MPTVLTTEQFDDLQQAVQDLDGMLRDYSGRGMYGASCPAAICDNPAQFLLRLGLLLGERRDDGDSSEAPIADLLEEADVSYDQMGLAWVVYWPGLRLADEDKPQLKV